jgi:hypothetical protein
LKGALRGVAGLAALVRTWGLDAEAERLPSLAVRLDLAALATALCGRLPVVSWDLLAAEVDEGAPAIVAGFDFFQVVVLHDGAPFALAPRRETERVAWDDAGRAAAALWEPTPGRGAWSKTFRQNVAVLRVSPASRTAALLVRRDGKLLTVRAQSLATLSEPRVLVGGGDGETARYVERHTPEGRVELAKYEAVEAPQWYVVLRGKRYAALDLGARRGLRVSHGAVLVWAGHRTPSGYTTESAALAEPTLSKLLALVRAGDPARVARRERAR